MKRPITLQIAGTRFRLVSDAEASQLEELAAMINARVEELQSKASHSASTTQLLALVALSLADDLQTAETRLAELEELTRTAIGRAIHRIDQRLG